MISPAAMFAALRRKRPLVDHFVRMYARYQEERGDRLAAAVTFYWFLSLFPVLLLVLAGYGYLHSGESAAQLNARLGSDLGGFLPAELIKTITDTLATAKGKAGAIGLAGLLVSGLGWIDALREAIRTIWHQSATAGNFITRKLIDIVVLVGLFATIAASAFITGLAGSGPKLALEQLGVDKTTAAKLFLQVVGLLLGAMFDVVLFLYLFVRLARVPTGVREVLRGAVFGAIAFGVLKLAGGFYVRHTTTSGQATYGTFAVVVGLLLFLNLVSRVVLYAAAFVVTSPYDSDTGPSGTADAEQPLETDVNRQEDGAPMSLRAAIHGRLALRDEAEEAGVERSWAARKSTPEPTPEPSSPDAAVPALSPTAPALQGAAQVQLAARLTAAAGGLLLAAVAVYALRTLKGFVRR